MRLLVIVGILLATGCLGDFPATIPVVLVEDAIVPEPGKRYDLRFGPHCADARYQGAPMEVHLNTYQERGRPTFVLLRRFAFDRNASMGMDGSLVAHWSDEKSGMVKLTAPMPNGTVLANVTWQASGIRVDGEDLAPGVVHERVYEDDELVETMRFTLHPETRVTWDDGSGRMCM